MHVSLHEIGSSKSDLARLRHFYDTLYSAEFPDPDERESFDNMETYLRNAGSGANAYHIVLALNGAETVGACIMDYFADSNAGVIEFIVVSPSMRGRHVGSRMLRDAERKLIADARSIGKTLAFIAAEINDPFERLDFDESIDPFERALWWDHQEYGRLDFPYVQPALSIAQGTVRNLMLGAKVFSERYGRSLPGTLVEAFVRDYLIYAMRIEDPTSSPEYAQMARWLRGHDEIPIVPLGAYVGAVSPPHFAPHEITDASDPILEDALRIYETSFFEPAIKIPRKAFYDLLSRKRDQLPYSYHFWALIDSQSEASVSGMASFFTFGDCGFGGYIAIAPPLRGNGALRSILPHIERRMITDSNRAEGWYIECADETIAQLFAQLGFAEISLTYEQPALRISKESKAEASRLRLMFKLFGKNFALPELDTVQFLSDMCDVLRYVYGVNNPRENTTYLSLAAQTQNQRFVPFRPSIGSEKVTASQS